MAFVWFSEAARLRCGKSDLATPYWAWGPRAEPEEFWQIWDGTAPTSHLFGLREALDMLARRGHAARLAAPPDAGRGRLGGV